MMTIKNAGLKNYETYARDMFMLSFYLLGINFKDLYYLQAIKNSRIEYKRFKTAKDYSILILPQASEIINRHRGQKSLLNCCEKYVNHRNFTKEMNKFLKRTAKNLGIDEPLTTYYSRHTWATIASGIDIPKETISAALGHEIGSATTAIYIDYDMAKVDAANKLVSAAVG